MSPANDTSALPVGTTYETATWRAHRYADSLRLTHVVNAGKRGKSCAELTLIGQWIEGAVPFIVDAMRGDVSPEAMGTALVDAAGDGLRVHRADLRGVDVILAPVMVLTDDVDAYFSPRRCSFRFTCDMPRPSGGTFREGTTAYTHKVRDAGKAYQWALANRTRIAGMDLPAFRREMSALGVRLG